MNKKYLNIVLLLVTTLLLVTLVASVSTVVINNPSASAVVGDNITLNATVTGDLSGTGANFTCIFYTKSASTANSSWTNVASVGNNTAGFAGTNFTNTTFNSVGVEDAIDYIFNATCVNNSNTIGSTTRTGITITNTVPTAPSSMTPLTGTTSSNASIIFNATVIGRQTTACTLIFETINPGQKQYSMTHTGNVCTTTLSSVLDQTYSFFVMASDGLNYTNSSTISFDQRASSSGNINRARTAGEIASQGGQVTSTGEIITSTEPKNNNLFFGIIGIIVVLAIAYFVKSRK